MIFTLEALQADYGDSLLLHFGDRKAPKLIVIDGGPPGIYDKSLKPRLLEIKEGVSPAAPLPISMVMVSHLDDDHVNGVLSLVDDVIQKKDDHDPAEFSIKNLWVNTFDDIVGNLQIPSISSIAASADSADISAELPEKTHREIVAVIASTGQGRQLRDDAKKLALTVNAPFKELKKGQANLVRSDAKKPTIDWEGLKITVLHPNEERLKKLQAQWDKDLKKAKAASDKSIMASLADTDTSPFNLSSIVCLVQTGGKKILLTGDGRSDDILQGLKANGLLDAKGKIHVDILKMPHHGSCRNMSPAFLLAVTADHYIISANGKFDNPDQELLDIMGENVKKGTLHLTNHDGEKGLKKKVDDFVKKLAKDGNKLKVTFRKEGESIVIDLIDKINF